MAEFTPEFTIILGNKNYSSWSLRGWLALKMTGAAFDEIVIPLKRPETREQILTHSPAAKVPIVKAGSLTVWDSLAIGEYLAERFPDAGLWPNDREARAMARAVCAEMHAGFPALRRALPMDIRSRHHRDLDEPAELAPEIARVVALWLDCRDRFGGGGDFLFGCPSLADAFFAPVVTRFVTYNVPLPDKAATYRDTVMAWPAMQDWIAAAKAEPWVLNLL